jgi:hypothetical protein
MVSNKLSHSGIGGKGKLSLEVSNQMSLITPQQGRNITVMIIMEGVGKGRRATMTYQKGRTHHLPL